VVKTGNTAVLDADQARKLLDSTVVGLRDRALVSVMTFAGEGLKARLAGHDSQARRTTGAVSASGRSSGSQRKP
jgi:hypothetical protein